MCMPQPKPGTNHVCWQRGREGGEEETSAPHTCTFDTRHDTLELLKSASLEADMSVFFRTTDMPMV
jgi:hypothetical protein